MNEQKDFWSACRWGDLTKVKSLSIQVDVNWENPKADNRTGLHLACSRGETRVVEYLLTLPQIDVNKGDRRGVIPLSLACANGKEEIIKMLAGDGRVHLNKETEDGVTPLWRACRWGYERSVKILLASGRADTKRRTDKDSWFHPTTTAAEVAGRSGEEELAALVEEYERNPKEVAQRLRRELNWPTPASAVFALMIFLCDGLLRLPADITPAQRFFFIASHLPLDLQHLLANRSRGLGPDNLPAADRELAFTSLARALQN